MKNYNGLIITSLDYKQLTMKKLLLLLLSSALVFTAMAQEDTTLQQYTGKYKFPEGSAVTEMTLTLEKGVLVGVSPMGSSEFRRIKGDEFEIVSYAGTATFKRTEGKVTGVQILVQDMVLEGSRTDGSSYNSVLINHYGF